MLPSVGCTDNCVALKLTVQTEPQSGLLLVHLYTGVTLRRVRRWACVEDGLSCQGLNEPSVNEDAFRFLQNQGGGKISTAIKSFDHC